MIKIKTRYFFVIYFLITLVLYYVTIGAGMVFDFNGWAMTYENGSFSDVLNCFGYPGLHQMEQLVFFSLYKLFGFNKFAWYIVFVFLHSLTAIISFKFIELFLKTILVENYYQIAILASFLFLISPMAADTVVNKVTIHYFMSTMFMVSALFFEVKYINTKKITFLTISFLLFVLALFSLEIAYVFPIIFTLVWVLILFFQKQLTFNILLNYKIYIPFIILIAFLVLHRVVVGSFIGHYGAEVHTKFDLSEIVSNIIRYFSSYFLMFDYWPYKFKEFASIKLLKFGLVLFVFILIAFIGLYFLFNKKYKKKLLVFLLFLVFGILALAPISNLYLAYMFPIENDRYAYFSSIFIYVSIVFFIYNIKIKLFRSAILLIFIPLNLYLLVNNIEIFSKSSKLTWSLIEDFRWFEKEVIILNDPDMLNGAKMFTTIGETTSFSESLFLYSGIDRRPNIKLVYQMNYNELTDSVIVTRINDYKYKVELAQWGNWFWKSNRGASSFENEFSKVIVNKEGRNYYIIELKEKFKTATLIYAAGDKWVEVD